MDTTMQVSIVVAMDDNDGIQVPKSRTVGLCLTPEADYIVGALPFSPAAQWATEDPEGLSEFVGIPWHPNPTALAEAGLTFGGGTHFPQDYNVIDGSLSPRPERFRRNRVRSSKPVGRKKRKK